MCVLPTQGARLLQRVRKLRASSKAGACGPQHPGSRPASNVYFIWLWMRSAASWTVVIFSAPGAARE